jgi:hypothetical protein
MCCLRLPLACKVQALCTVIPEGHADTRNRVENLEATDGFRGVAGIPQAQLTIAHAGESSSRNAVGLAHPYSTTVFRARVTGNLLSGLLLTNIPYTQLLVTASGDQLGAIGAPGERLNDVVVLERELGLAGFDIPKLHGVVTRGTGKNALGSGVEQDVADFPVGALAT